MLTGRIPGYPLGRREDFIGSSGFFIESSILTHKRKRISIKNVNLAGNDFSRENTRFFAGVLVNHTRIHQRQHPINIRRKRFLAVEGHADSHEIGRAALVTPEADGKTFQNHLFRVRLLEDVKFNHRFLLGWKNSERVRRHWNATANTSSGLNTINRTGLRRLLIPRPTDEEQEQIATLLDAADSNIEAIESEIAALQRLKISLLQNLLTGRVRIKVENGHEAAG